MSSAINCPSCHMKLSVGPQMVGQNLQCPGCKNWFVIDVPGQNISQPPQQQFTQAAPQFPPQKHLPPSHLPPHQGGGSTVPWVLGIFGGGCLLIVLLGVLAALILPAVQQVNVAAKRQAAKNTNLLIEREGFKTRLTRNESESDPPPRAPRNLFDTVKFDSSVGKLSAYVRKDPGDGQKHPAIIWLFGGFSNSIGETAWEFQPETNDQSARAYWQSNIITMYPSLRGGNDNPGYKEGFFGEVDDVLAAADFLASLPYVDPDRIYLGGHSTGGTLALLCTAATDRFRATIALGPVDDVSGYGQEVLPFDIWDQKELRFRNPKEWLGSIKTRTFIIEGSRGNADGVREMDRLSRHNNNIQCYVINLGDHFNIIGPVNRLMAQRIVEDIGPTCGIAITQQELEQFVR